MIFLHLSRDPFPSPVHTPFIVPSVVRKFFKETRKISHKGSSRATDKGAAEGNENALCVATCIVYSSPSIVETCWMAREKKKKRSKPGANSEKSSCPGLVTRARKLGVEGWKEDPVNSEGKKRETMASQSPLRPCSDALFPTETLARFHPADYHPLRVASAGTQLRIRKSERRI